MFSVESLTNNLQKPGARPVPWRNARHLLCLATLVLAMLTQAEPALAEDESIPCDPEPTDMSISYSDVVSCSIDVVGDVDVFRFSGIAGEAVSARASKLSGVTTVPCVELFDPAGAPVGSHCLAQGARFGATLAQTGVYSILVSEFANDNPMDYTLVVERVAPPSFPATYICPGCELQDGIDPPGDVDLFFFFGTAGDVVSALGSKLSGVTTVPCIELFDPAGGVVGAHCLSQGARIDATLAHTGVHSILVSEFANDNTMDYTLSYQCIVGVCADLIFSDGFESGDTSAWSGSWSRDAQVLGSAAVSGAYGLQATVGVTCSPDDLTINSPPMISGDFEACNSVTASGVEVISPGATFLAGASITLANDFSVASGAGLTALIDPSLPTPFAWVRDDSPTAETLYSAIFHLRLDALNLAIGDEIGHLVGFSSNDEPQFRVVLRKNPTLLEDRLAILARQDGGGFVEHSSEFLLPAGYNRIEIAWRAGAGDGELLVSINGAPLSGLAGLDNDGSRIDYVKWGAVDGTPTSTTGEMELDEFFSFR